MDNEKSVYEMILEDKDKIINFQQELINKLIRTLIIIIGMVCIVFSLFLYGYFFSNYDYGTHINGDSNNSVQDSKLDNSEMNLDK